MNKTISGALLKEVAGLADAVYDDKGKNLFMNLDENFDKLQIWQDSNSNGVSETNELKSLSELGIESLNLNKFTNLNLLVA